nr:hypothetical protein [Ochrobactrum sp. UNC390CL2Tsu3S39]
MDDQLSAAELEEVRATLRGIMVELARQAAWNDHQASLKLRKNRKRVLVPVGGQCRWRYDNENKKCLGDEE